MKLDPFQIFVKPTGPICNLDCTYCYYLEKERLYPETPSFRMSDELLEEYIIQHIEATSGAEVRFSWHGGEPTLAGIDFFRKVVSLQKRQIPSGRRAHNGLVTNGTTLDEGWCRFLAEEGFSVGLSLDGPRELHDGYRITRGGKPTHRKVIHALGLLKDHRIPTDILCVVHDRNVQYPLEVYRFFKEIGAVSVGFLPLVVRDRDAEGNSASSGSGMEAVPAAPGEGEVMTCSVPAEAFGDFLCAIFDEWVRHDIGRIMIQLFDEAARPVRGLEHSLCIYRQTCGDIPVLEHNGDLYSCDHFVDEEHLLGNILETPLSGLLASTSHRMFGENKRTLLPDYCLECEVLDMCNGGCPKDRFIRTPDGEEGLNYLCAGYRRFFNHCRPMFERLVPLWKAGASAEQLMQAAREADTSPSGATAARPGVAHAGRNDPCPCGSGRKYKNCCMPRS